MKNIIKITMFFTALYSYSQPLSSLVVKKKFFSNESTTQKLILYSDDTTFASYKENYQQILDIKKLLDSKKNVNINSLFRRNATSSDKNQAFIVASEAWAWDRNIRSLYNMSFNENRIERKDRLLAYLEQKGDEAPVFSLNDFIIFFKTGMEESFGKDIIAINGFPCEIKNKNALLLQKLHEIPDSNLQQVIRKEGMDGSSSFLKLVSLKIVAHINSFGLLQTYYQPELIKIITEFADSLYQAHVKKYSTTLDALVVLSTLDLTQKATIIHLFIPYTLRAEIERLLFLCGWKETGENTALQLC